MKVPSPEPYPLPRTCWTTLPQNPIPCLAAARERPPWPQGSQVATASRESGHHRQAVATWTGREGRVQAPSSVAGGTLGPLAAWASKPLASRTSVPPPPRRLKASSNNRVEGASTPPPPLQYGDSYRNDDMDLSGVYFSLLTFVYFERMQCDMLYDVELL
jgi:hypothetical protein